VPSVVEEQTSLDAPRSTALDAVLFDPATSFSRLDWIAVAAITLAGASLRLHSLGARSLWFDEGFGAGIALMSWRDFGFLCSGSTANMAFYYLLLKFWLALGHSDAWTRGLSFLFGVAGIPALFGLARRMFGSGTAIAAALLLATNAFHLKYSREARPYSLVALLCIVSAGLLLRALEHNSGRAWIAWAIVSALAMYSHLYAVLVIGAQVVWVVAFVRPVDWRRAAAAARLFILSIVPLVIGLLRGSDVTFWLRPLTFQRALEAIEQLCGNAGIVLPVVFVASLIGAYRLRGLERRGFALAVLWAVMPIAIVILVSFHKPSLLPRYLMPCLPAILLAACAAAMNLPKKLAVAWLALAVSVSLFGAYSYSQHDFVPHDDWRSATAYVREHRTANDLVVLYTMQGVLPFRYYQWQADPSSPRPHPSELYFDGIATMIQQLPAGAPRVWLVLNQYQTPNGPDPGSQFVQSWFRHSYRQSGEADFEGIKVVEYVKP